jgi:peroxiredoxin Q/BCP
MLREGLSAPDFQARLTTGEEVRLSDFRGRKNVVLFFYPKDFTPGCTAEACSLRDNYDEIRRYDAVIFGVSPDSEASHEQFIRRHRLPFPLISDRDGAVARAYGASGRLGGLLPGIKRVTFVIDRAGVIRAVIHHEFLIRKHLESILEALQRLASAA